MSHQKYAFRCKNCGHLIHAAHAGEKNFPYSCPVCKAGIVPAMSLALLKKDRPELFEGLKDIEIDARVTSLAHGMIAFADHSNWQILADMTPEELKAIDHCLEPHHCERHTPSRIEVHSRPSQAIERTAEDGSVVVKDVATGVKG